MSREVNAIAGRLSLRLPQRQSLEILAQIASILPMKKGGEPATILHKLCETFPSVTDFERNFPSLCFALATGVGKTRLMGAFVTYLHAVHGINNFFVLAPNLTIYNKLIQDFGHQNHPKYVFKGIGDLAVNGARIITGDNYEKINPSQTDLFSPININIFNIAKITSETRGGKSPRIKRLSEYLGESYFDYLASLPDLVLLMDESHRYRASSGLKAINELNPILGLELTATPFVETGGKTKRFNNIIYEYPLAQAITDGYVKEPAVVTRKNFNPANMAIEEIEHIKLEDGLRVHEDVKVYLETYAREQGKPIVKPFLLVIARDTTHASQLLKIIQSDSFFDGRYKEKVIQVDSSKSGADEEQMIAKLLKVEHTEEPTEIVIHVNMLKEGWDVTNLYTIVPLRAANARTLIEQSIGRGLRLPYGIKTGVASVDRLNIIAHDRFQEIVDEANRPNSIIQLQKVELNDDFLEGKKTSVIAQPHYVTALGLEPVASDNPVVNAYFITEEEQKIAKITRQVIKQLSASPEQLPALETLKKPEQLHRVLEEVEAKYHMLSISDEKKSTELMANVVNQVIDLAIQNTINIPRIIVYPQGEVKTGFKPFQLQLGALKYPPISDEIWIQYLSNNERISLDSVSDNGVQEERLENYIVAGLVDFDDIAYEEHADLLYDLATQTVQHFRSYLSEAEAHKVLRCYKNEIAQFIHAQMQNNYWEDVTHYEVKVNQGFSELKSTAFTYSDKQPPLHFRNTLDDKGNITKYVFNGFERCLYNLQKFDSDSERKMAIILDRDSLKWFKPVKGQMQIDYKNGHEHAEYIPDFIAETDNACLMIEVKMRKELMDPVVLAKKEAAQTWCKHASEHARSYQGKEWIYLLIPHDEIKENVELAYFERMSTE